MLLRSTQKIQVITSAVGQVDIVWEIADFDSGGSPAVMVDGDILRITTAATTDIVPVPTGNYRRRLKHLSISNTHASANQTITIQIVDSVGPKTAILDSFPLLAGERASFREGVAMRIIDANGMEKVNPILVAGQLPVVSLAADQSNSTVTPTAVTGMTQSVGAGTWLFEYFLRMQSAAATTGHRLSVNHTGTVTAFMAQLMWPGGTAASADLADQDFIAAGGQLLSGFFARAKSTAGWGTTTGVDTLAADVLYTITGLMVVTVGGNIELWHGSEVAAATTVKAGSALRLTKVG